MIYTDRFAMTFRSRLYKNLSIGLSQNSFKMMSVYKFFVFFNKNFLFMVRFSAKAFL